MELYCCDGCGYVYDPEDGDPEGEIKPGVAFKKLPKEWRCPECGADKEDFFLIAPPADGELDDDWDDEDEDDS